MDPKDYLSSHLPPKGSTIAVGMSGGVDSSVTAALLKDAGYDVFGLFMKNWEEEDADGKCLASYDQADVQKVCEKLSIPFYGVNFTKEYQEEVFQDFLEDLKKGLTPNPDILCNREIKFKHFLQKALSIGATHLATGHYCQIKLKDNALTLYKGLDLGKDQTYFVYTLKEEKLNKILFPVGHLLKQDVRKLARYFDLPNSEKKDSTGICFIGKRNFKEFVSHYIPKKKGLIVDIDGKKVGEHEGAIYYTIGQRKGLGIGGEGDAWFVVDKDIHHNYVIVAQGQDHPTLYAESLVADTLSWINHPPTTPFTCHAKIRYRQEDQECVIEQIVDGKALIKFAKPQRAITLSQAIVFYNNSICLGGGTIIEKGPSLYQISNKTF